MGRQDFLSNLRLVQCPESVHKLPGDSSAEVGPQVMIYLEDLLLMAQEEDYLTLEVAQAVDPLEESGFMVNQENCNSSQCKRYHFWVGLQQ